MENNISKFKESYTNNAVSFDTTKNVVEEYKNILPEEIIQALKEFDLFYIDNGLLWFVNPNDYVDILEEWAKANEMLTLEDRKYYVIARTAFGCLLIWVCNGNNSYLSYLDILSNEWSVPSTDMDFFLNVLLLDYTYKEDDLDEVLFKKCYKSLGLLKSDECYGFVPLPALGGAKDVKLAEKVKLKEYLSICSQVFG